MLLLNNYRCSKWSLYSGAESAIDCVERDGWASGTGLWLHDRRQWKNGTCCEMVF